MLGYILKLIFGSKSDRDLKKMKPFIAKINKQEEEYQSISTEELQNKTQEFKDRLEKGESLDDLMVEAFAVVKNAARRLCGTTVQVCDHELEWEMIHYDVQLMGGMALHNGNIAEMATGEGKTLVATLPLYLNSLTGKNCQLITVNDYLARRDSEWMGHLFKFLGLTVGCLQNSQHPELRREQYQCDITYGTNSEFGFDYLRDMGMATEKDELVQRDYHYAIIDEVDSILIDEARTPLIISGPVAVSTHQFKELNPFVSDLFTKQSHFCSRLMKEAKETLNNLHATDDETDDAITKLFQVKMGMPQQKQLIRLVEDGSILKKLEKAESFIRSDQNRGLLQEVQADLYFVMDEKTHDADLTEKGRNAIAPNDPDAFILHDLSSDIIDIDSDENLSLQEKIEEKQKVQDEYNSKSERLHNLSQLLKAYCLFEKDKSYVVQDGKVMIVDEHTGRLMAGRRYSDGLHQAIEAKERVTIEKETQTLASITIQNYFRMYDKLSGMTGTAETEASELHQIYKIDVIVIPTNKPCVRLDKNDTIYKTKREKYAAIIDAVSAAHEKGQPVLLGTASVDVSELLGRMLKTKGIPHNILNAKNHEREADIIANAGQVGAVTVATNMAGRGTDIKLGEGVTDLGGLCVIASERHDSRRIDRQLRGRCARQGDRGESSFYVSLEDNLMRLFGSDRIVSIMERFGFEEGDDLQHPLLNRSIETAQKRVEQQHFAVRKRTLEYDDVMNKQREIIYKFRRDAILSETPREMLLDILYNEIFNKIEQFMIPSEAGDGWNKSGLLEWLKTTFPVSFEEDDIKELDLDIPNIDIVGKRIYAKVEKLYLEKEALEESDHLVYLERSIMLNAVDKLWQEHLYGMDHLRSSIGLRAYAQKNPLVEYKNEGFKLFDILMGEINQAILVNMFRSATNLEAFEHLIHDLPQQQIHDIMGQFGAEEQVEEEPSEMPEITFERVMPKVGRNDLCPCESGKKYKKCCGK